MIRSVLDLETLGTAPGCAVTEIGLTIQFSDYPSEIYRHHLIIDRQASIDIGLTIDPGTLAWHARHPDAWSNFLLMEAGNLIHSADYTTHTNWRDALDSLFDQVSTNLESKEIDEIWANGASFDFPILRHIANKIACPIPWKYTAERCFRTLRAYTPELDFPKNSHTAIEDALNQHHYINKAIPLPPPPVPVQ